MSERPKLSIVVIAHNMRREIVRTLWDHWDYTSKHHWTMRKPFRIPAKLTSICVVLLGYSQRALIRQSAMVSHRGQRVLAVTLHDTSAQPDFASILKSLSFANVDSIRIIKRLPLDQRHNSKVDYPKLHQLLDQ